MCHLDKPSHLAPSGARGHRLILSPSIANKLSVSAIGKPIWTRHIGYPEQREIGRITECRVIEGKVTVSGVSPEIDLETVQASAAPDFGMSLEIGQAKVSNMLSEVWIVVDFEEFKGCAVQAGVSFESSFQWIEE